MEYTIVDLPEIAIIGKLGLCTKGNNIVSDLWNQANSNFNEVKDLAMKDDQGNFVGFWGAMSDETMSYKPWTNDFTTGYYLAGVEVYKDTPVPANWDKWIMPARKYLVVDVTPDTYGQIFNEVLSKTLVENAMELKGAVCDFTDPKTGQNKLFFPIG